MVLALSVRALYKYCSGHGFITLLVRALFQYCPGHGFDIALSVRALCQYCPGHGFIAVTCWEMFDSVGSTSVQTKPTPCDMLDRYQDPHIRMLSLGSGNEIS